MNNKTTEKYLITVSLPIGACFGCLKRYMLKKLKPLDVTRNIDEALRFTKSESQKIADKFNKASIGKYRNWRPIKESTAIKNYKNK